MRGSRSRISRRARSQWLPELVGELGPAEDLGPVADQPLEPLKRSLLSTDLSPGARIVLRAAIGTEAGSHAPPHRSATVVPMVARGRMLGKHAQSHHAGRDQEKGYEVSQEAIWGVF